MVAEFLLKRGAPGAVGVARGELLPLVAGLRTFSSVDDSGRDHGLNVRVRSAAQGRARRPGPGLAPASGEPRAAIP